LNRNTIAQIYLAYLQEEVNPLTGIKDLLSKDEKYKQISIFNTSKMNLKTREYSCNILLTYYRDLSESKTKNFPPLDFLISFYKSQKNVDQLLRLKKFIQEYPMLFELYDYKINKILSKV